MHRRLMLPLRRTTPHGVRARDERGAMAVTLGLLLPMVLALSALGVNHAALWTERRALVQATDAAALAAAMELATGGATAAVESVCRDHLARNHSATAAASATCSVLDERTVRVRASAPAPVLLLPAGLELDSTMSATSVAESGIPLSLVGVRPLAICRRDPAYVDWLTRRDPSIRYEILGSDACPRSSEVLRTADRHRRIEKVVLAADGGNGGNQLSTLMARGTDHARTLCEPLGPRSTWSYSERTALGQAVGTTFPVVVYGYSDRPIGEGPESNCGNFSGAGRTIFPVLGFVGLELHEVRFSSSGSARRFVVSFHEIDATGRCCSMVGLPGAKAVRLCDPVGGCRARQWP